MSKVDWSFAKSWADRVVVGPLSGKQYWANEERRIQFGGEFDCKDDNHIREGWTTTEFKPKPWSGPEDGLPPSNTVCQMMDDAGCWIDVLIIANYDGYAHGWTSAEKGCFYSNNPNEFRSAQTPEDQRESAIRELMDIAQVDCLVTAARLVDAGFKREGV